MKDGAGSPKGGQAGAEGRLSNLSQAALEGPAKTRMPRAPFFNNTEKRARQDAIECSADRGDRERKLVDRRSQVLAALMPKVA